MPVITVSHRELDRLVGKQLSHQEVEELAFSLAGEVEAVEGDAISLKFEPIRPDLFSVEGFARACRGLLGLHEGLWKYAVAPPRWTLKIDPSVATVRPHMVAARLTGVKLDDDTVRSVIDLQDKLDASIGRGRRRVSIGLHDPARLHPGMVYKGVAWDSNAFVPLGHTEPMTPREILEKHEKGVMYAHILEGAPAAPLLVDSRDQVLSMPPIINGILTRVTPDTSELFLDVTGTDLNACNRTLDILCCALADRGAAIEAVTIAGEGAKHHAATPDLSPEKWDLRFSEVVRVLGGPRTEGDAVAGLRRAGHDAHERGGGMIEVHAPAYRADLLHTVDLVEDVAIGLGYASFPDSLPRHSTFAIRHPRALAEEMVAQSLLGQGYTEVSTLLLTNLASSVGSLASPGAPATAGGTRLHNPIIVDHTHLRTSLVPDLLNSFRINKHRDMPQRLFEVGVVIDGARDARRVGFAAMHPRASFTECKSAVEALVRDMRKGLRVEATIAPGYLPGRCAAALMDGKKVGEFGEIHPAVLERYELGAPVHACELDFDALTE